MTSSCSGWTDSQISGYLLISDLLGSILPYQIALGYYLVLSGLEQATIRTYFNIRYYQACKPCTKLPCSGPIARYEPKRCVSSEHEPGRGRGQGGRNNTAGNDTGGPFPRESAHVCETDSSTPPNIHTITAYSYIRYVPPRSVSALCPHSVHDSVTAARLTARAASSAPARPNTGLDRACGNRRAVSSLTLRTPVARSSHVIS